MTPNELEEERKKRRAGQKRRRQAKSAEMKELKKEKKEREEKEKKEREERAAAPPPRSGTWQGRGRGFVPRGTPFRHHQFGPPRPFGPSYGPYPPPPNPYAPPPSAYQPQPYPHQPAPMSALPPSPYLASPAAPTAVATPSGPLAEPSSAPALSQQQVAVLGQSKIQKPKKEKKKREWEKKKREVEKLKREAEKLEEEKKKKQEKEEEEKKKREEKEEEEKKEKKRDEERKAEDERREKRDEERREEDRRHHRELLQMMTAQTAAQDAARATQAERERMQASFNSLAAAAEHRLASRRGNFLEARGMAANNNNNELWARYNAAFLYCDRVIGQILNWRTTATMEAGSTPESALIIRLSSIENEAMSLLQDAPPIVAPGLMLPPAAPASQQIAPPSQVGAQQPVGTSLVVDRWLDQVHGTVETVEGTDAKMTDAGDEDQPQ